MSKNRSSGDGSGSSARPRPGSPGDRLDQLVEQLVPVFAGDLDPGLLAEPLEVRGLSRGVAVGRPSSARSRQRRHGEASRSRSVAARVMPATIDRWSSVRRRSMHIGNQTQTRQ